MPTGLRWDDAEQIGILLSEKHLEAGPLAGAIQRAAPLRNRTKRLQRRSQNV